MKAARYVIYDNKLYRRSYSMLLLKCVILSKVDYIMKEIHEGIYENHIEGQSLVFKTLRQGYYCLTSKSNCMEFAKNGYKFQHFAPMSKAHLEELTTMTSP